MQMLPFIRLQTDSRDQEKNKRGVKEHRRSRSLWFVLSVLLVRVSSASVRLNEKENNKKHKTQNKSKAATWCVFTVHVTGAVSARSWCIFRRFNQRGVPLVWALSELSLKK